MSEPEGDNLRSLLLAHFRAAVPTSLDYAYVLGARRQLRDGSAVIVSRSILQAVAPGVVLPTDAASFSVEQDGRLVPVPDFKQR